MTTPSSIYLRYKGGNSFVFWKKVYVYVVAKEENVGFLLFTACQSYLEPKKKAETKKYSTFLKHFNPPSLCRERHHANVINDKRLDISIHSPHTGRDPLNECASITASHFNPLSPYRETARYCIISILFYYIQFSKEIYNITN